ncbi:hypothetical protein NIES4106_59190 (plasmid) [Fischerella sp. NIES-4106]|nr:hypothetical protein NIES4106_59190 [Fischerella sp. NIES-4106]
MNLSSVNVRSVMDLESLTNPYVRKIQVHREYFHRSLECFTEKDSSFRPSNDCLTVAGQVIHVIFGIEFCLSGMFGSYDGITPVSQRKRGFNDLDWTVWASEMNLSEALDAEAFPEAIEGSRSLIKAMVLFDQAMDIAANMFVSKTVEEIETEPLPENPLWAPEFRYPDILEVMNDHTAHHRGSLAVYARLLGKESKFPYRELSEARKEEETSRVRLVLE